MGNIIEDGLGESPEVATSIARRHALAPRTAVRAHPTSQLPPYIGLNARMASGKGKRPLSTDTGAGKGSVRDVVESDYTTYI